MGLFDFFGDEFTGGPAGPAQGAKQRVFPAVVLEVCLDDTSNLWETSADVGKIRFKDVGNAYFFTPKPEDVLVTVAWPLSRGMAQYPLPGEQVMVYEAFGDIKLPFANVVQKLHFYSSVVSSTHNPTYNQQPFIMSSQFTIEKGTRVPFSIAEKRFQKQLIDREKFTEGDDTKIFKQLTPYEGDFILQGRSGNTFRLSATGKSAEKDNSPWKGRGQTGDPITVIRVSSDNTTDPEEQYTYEDVNKDEGSIYLCSSQNVELKLQCTKEMKTWLATYDITEGDSLEKVPSTSKLFEQDERYAKIVDMAKPVAQEYTPTTPGNPQGANPPTDNTVTPNNNGNPANNTTQTPNQTPNP